MPTSVSSRRVLPSRNARAENINYSDALIAAAAADGVGYREEDSSEVAGGGVSGGVREVDHNENYNVYEDEGDNYGDEVSWYLFAVCVYHIIHTLIFFFCNFSNIYNYHVCKLLLYFGT
jgi:hypothetical protein